MKPDHKHCDFPNMTLNENKWRALTRIGNDCEIYNDDLLNNIEIRSIFTIKQVKNYIYNIYIYIYIYICIYMMELLYVID